MVLYNSKYSTGKYSTGINGIVQVLNFLCWVRDHFTSTTISPSPFWNWRQCQCSCGCNRWGFF